MNAFHHKTIKSSVDSTVMLREHTNRAGNVCYWWLLVTWPNYWGGGTETLDGKFDLDIPLALFTQSSIYVTRGNLDSLAML